MMRFWGLIWRQIINMQKRFVKKILITRIENNESYGLGINNQSFLWRGRKNGR